MGEYNIGYLAAGSVAALSIACLLYMMGGRNNKGIRRFGASFIIAAACNVTTFLMGAFSFFLLLLYPLKIAEFSLGYGGNGKIPRTVQRALIVLVSLLGGLVFCLLFGGNAWWVLAVQAIVGIPTIFFSVKNPVYAAAEEVMVCVLNNGVLLFYPFVVI